MMITKKVKNLFTFIDFLHSEIAYFQSKKPLIDELLELGNKRSSLEPSKNYKDRLEYNKVQNEIEKKFDFVQPQTTTIILNKALELDIAPMNTPSLNLSAQSDLFELQRNFEEGDLSQINEAKTKYLEFRTQTDCHYFLQMFFNDLDRDLKDFFDYFKDTNENEFETFEVNTFEAYDLEDLPELMLQGYKNISLPMESFLDASNTDNRNISSNFSLKYDFPYSLNNFLEYNKNDKESQKIADLINNYGHFIVEYEGKEFKLYTPELCMMLTSRNLKAQNKKTQTDVFINGWEYFKTYAKGYEEGEKYFENEFKVSANTLYGANAEQYVKDIHLNYFHAKHTETHEGWAYVKNTYPYILTHKAIKKFGYYSGIVNKVEELIKTFPKLFAEFNKCEHNITPQPIVKQKPELPSKQITFKNSETIQKIHTELKGYFINKEAELLRVLNGEQLTELLLFPHNQNKFVEVFRRLKYNGFLLNTDTETKNWICRTFQFIKKGFIEPQPFNESSVWDNLNKGKGEPTKKERICIEWLPYKSPLQLIREIENEKL